jgi:hypothetical protein
MDVAGEWVGGEDPCAGAVGELEDCDVVRGLPAAAAAVEDEEEAAAALPPLLAAAAAFFCAAFFLLASDTMAPVG